MATILSFAISGGLHFVSNASNELAVILYVHHESLAVHY